MAAFRAPLHIENTIGTDFNQEKWILIYAVGFHSVAGVVAGSFFKVRTLLLILSIVLVESAVLTTRGFELAAVWGLTNIIFIQVGYFAGISLRGVLDQAGHALPSAKVRSPEN